MRKAYAQLVHCAKWTRNGRIVLPGANYQGQGFIHPVNLRQETPSFTSLLEEITTNPQLGSNQQISDSAVNVSTDNHYTTKGEGVTRDSDMFL